MIKIKVLVAIFIFLFPAFAFAQTYSATQGTVSNKPYAPAQAVPTDSRSYYYDGTNFLWRPYQSTTEVLSYLNLTKYRVGHFTIFVNPTGTLNLDGSFTGGNIVEYWFKNGTANGNLVPKYDTTKAWQQALIDSSTNIRSTVNSKQSTLSLTTTGTSGPATLIGSTLNVPQYGGGGSVSITGSSSTGVIVTPSPITGTGTIKNDTTVIPTRLYLQKIADSLSAIQDTVDIVNILTAGTALSYGNITADTVWLKRIKAGTNVTLTQNTDSSVTISSASSTNIYNTDGSLTSNRTVTQNGSNFIHKDVTSNGATYQVLNQRVANLNGSWLQVNKTSASFTYLNGITNGSYGVVSDSTNGGQAVIYASEFSSTGKTGYINVRPDSIEFKSTDGIYKFRSVPSATLSSAYKPMMWNSTNNSVYYGTSPYSAHVSSPTFTYVTNTSATSTAELTYQVIGDMVHVYGKVTIVATASGAGELGMSFPFSTTIANDYDVAGTGVASGFPGEPLEISGDVANNRIKLKTIFASSGTRTYFITFMYKYSPS